MPVVFFSLKPFLLSNNIIYYTEEITKEEYDNSNYSTQSTSIETTYKKLTTTISQKGSYYHYDVQLNWKNMPKVRSYDIISLSFYESVTPFNISFRQKYCESISSCTTETNYTQHLESDGVSAIFKLPSSTTINSLSSNLSFDVRKTTSATVLKQRLVGDYAHFVPLVADLGVTSTSSPLYDFNAGVVKKVLVAPALIEYELLEYTDVLALTHGAILLKGKDTSKLRENEKAEIRNKEIGFIFQSYYLNPYMTAIENVMLPTYCILPSYFEIEI